MQTESLGAQLREEEGEKQDTRWRWFLLVSLDVEHEGWESLRGATEGSEVEAGYSQVGSRGEGVHLTKGKTLPLLKHSEENEDGDSAVWGGGEEEVHFNLHFPPNRP